MTFSDIEKKAKEFYPALLLERLVARNKRNKLRSIFLLVSVICLSFYLMRVTPIYEELLALAFLSAATWLVLFASETFYNSHFFLDVSMSRLSLKHNRHVSFEVASIIYTTSLADITKGFLDSDGGKELMARCGIFSDTLNNFLGSRVATLDAQNILFSDKNIYFSHYSAALYDSDKEFSDFLFKHSIQRSDYLKASRWIERRIREAKQGIRWWSRNNLMRIKRIGTDWSFGHAYLLERYAVPVGHRYDLTLLAPDDVYRETELIAVETVLSRSREANVVLVGEQGVGKMEIVAHLAAKINNGNAYAALQNKHMFLLDGNVLVAEAGNKNTFERLLMKMLVQAVSAGNIILVIENLPSFISSAAALGSDVVSIIDPYLSSNNLQVIALSDTARYHQIIESNSQLSERFEKVLVERGDDESVERVIEDRVAYVEFTEGVFFTYPAVESVVSSAEQYFSDGVMPDKALDLLSELVSHAEHSKKYFIEKSDVQKYIESKTGIPIGSIGEEERDKLMNLEKILHERVIGQDDAIGAISNAMRRARSGIGNPKRPIGSFLFIGPTGVGKTETTKALASVFFKDETKIMRLDMSEYNSPDALTRMIGSFENDRSGVLSSMLRENPYGVLLLDEFEKCHSDVRDLFLQILDEGFFSDMSGKKVNARNTIIIATSNAGSSLIWDAIKQGKNLIEEKGRIVDSIIHEGTFRPELLNRFDGVILFHPLSSEHIREVSRIMLEKFKGRIRERGYDLEITDDIVQFLVEQGNDPQFGARPINRAIQETIEGAVAEKIIQGALQPGEKILLTKDDLVARITH